MPRSPRFFFYIQSWLRDSELAVQCADSVLATADPRIARVVIAVEQSTDPDPRHDHVAPGEQLHPGSNHPMISKAPCCPTWGWDNSLGQIRSFGIYANDAAEHGAAGDDIIVRLDADVYFASRAFLDLLSSSESSEYAAFGFHHTSAPGEIINKGCYLGNGWSHMSGFCISMRQWQAREIGSLDSEYMAGVRDLMRHGEIPGGICTTEDAAISFTLGVRKANICKVPWSIASAHSFEGGIMGREPLDGIYHLNSGGVFDFGPVQAQGKGDVPRAVRLIRQMQAEGKL